MMIRLFLILSLLVLTVFPVMSQDACVQPTHVAVGEDGRVLRGDANNVRANPDTSAELVGKIVGGGEFTVLSEPVCDADYVWIQVQAGDLMGWTVEATVDEYWVQPITGNIYENAYVSLMIPDELATDVNLEVEDELQTMGGLFPIRVTGEIEIVEDVPLYRAPRLVVAPIAEFENGFAERAQDAIDDLNILFDTDSEFTELILENVTPGQSAPELTFPADPFMIASRRLLVVAPHYVDMTNGRGIAFITMYGQDIFPVNNNAVFYNFVGITTDEQYLVSFRYPVQTDMLVGQETVFEDIPNWRDTYSTYIQQATESLNTLASDEWHPALDDLDAVIQSIQVIGGFE